VPTGYNSPVVSLVTHAVVVLVLNLFPFEVLVEADMLLTAVRCAGFIMWLL
jgi:hypothetical protein